MTVLHFVIQVFTVSERESGELEMRFRVVNGTRRDDASRGEILEVSFKLILMRVEVGVYAERMEFTPFSIALLSLSCC